MEHSVLAGFPHKHRVQECDKVFLVSKFQEDVPKKDKRKWEKEGLTLQHVDHLMQLHTGRC
jgi:hypothetical protein